MVWEREQLGTESNHSVLGKVLTLPVAVKVLGLLAVVKVSGREVGSRYEQALKELGQSSNNCGYCCVPCEEGANPKSVDKILGASCEDGANGRSVDKIVGVSCEDGANGRSVDMTVGVSCDEGAGGGSIDEILGVSCEDGAGGRSVDKILSVAFAVTDVLCELLEQANRKGQCET